MIKVKHWNKAISISEPWPEAGLGEHIPAQLRKNLNAIFSSLHCWTGAHSSGLKASIPVRKVFLSSLLLARMRDGPSRFGMREFCFMAPLQSLLLVLLHSLELGQHHTTHRGLGLSHASSGVFETETPSGKTKFQLFYSPFLCILWIKTIILIKWRRSCETQS